MNKFPVKDPPASFAKLKCVDNRFCSIVQIYTRDCTYELLKVDRFRRYAAHSQKYRLTGV